LQAVLLILLGIVFLFSSSYAFGSDDPYTVQSNRFTSKPTVCVVEPSKENLSHGIVKSVMTEAKASVYDWINSLQEKTTNKNKWAINYLEISNRVSDFSSCSVIVNFKNEVNVKKLSNLGTHKYIDGTSYITIFYQTNQCKANISCKTNVDSLVTRIGATLRHEFGHAVGLGHYTSDKSKNQEWFENPETAPSIMLAYSKGSKHERVTSGDIDKVIEIYDDSGFTNQHLPKQQQTIPMALTQIESKDLLSVQIIETAGQIDAIKISGFFEKKNQKLESVTLTMIKPNFETEKIKLLLDKDGYFEHEHKVHNKIPKGIYYVQVKNGKDITEKNMFELK
jgi:hypothetical protein